MVTKNDKNKSMFSRTLDKLGSLFAPYFPKSGRFSLLFFKLFQLQWGQFSFAT
jgi:hypothetical protein